MSRNYTLIPEQVVHNETPVAKSKGIMLRALNTCNENDVYAECDHFDRINIIFR